MKKYFFIFLAIVAMQFFTISNSYAQLIIEQEEEDTREVFDSWEAAISKPEKVQILSLAYKGIESLSSKIGDFVNLEEIYLNDNKLSSLPKELFTLTKLKKIDISGNYNLVTIPSDLAKLSTLEFFKFGYNEKLNYAEVFKSLSKLPNLKTVDMMSNKLRVLPAEIGVLKQIETLNLADNRFLVLPEEIGNLSNLKMLDLSQNQLSKLPDSFTKLSSLKELHIIGNSLSDSEISSLKQKLSGCKFDL